MPLAQPSKGTFGGVGCPKPAKEHTSRHMPSHSHRPQAGQLASHITAQA